MLWRAVACSSVPGMPLHGMLSPVRRWSFAAVICTVSARPPTHLPLPPCTMPSSQAPLARCAATIWQRAAPRWVGVGGWGVGGVGGRRSRGSTCVLPCSADPVPRCIMHCIRLILRTPRTTEAARNRRLRAALPCPHARPASHQHVFSSCPPSSHPPWHCLACTCGQCCMTLPCP